ncbi:MAG: prepilin peptidase [Gammaproteobacteria bacterium]|nr:prepilin peptidase [Gammaproteobacteria bacterium]
MLVEAFAGSTALLVGAVLLLGLLVGSFLNVVIHRVPIMLEREWQTQCEELERERRARAAAAAGAPGPSPDAPSTPPGQPAKAETYNLVVPRSACPACRAPITALQNVPVVSWLALRGRCASCGARISARYPLVELLTGALSATVAWKFGFGWPLLAALVLTWYLVALTFIDLDTQLLPDSLTLPLLWIGLVLSLWATGNGGAAVPVEPRTAIIGAAAGYLSLWSVYWLFKLATGKEGMGYGDFKLLAALGAWLGWKMILPIVLCSALVGAVVGVALMLRFGRDRSVPIAFGPYLAAAGWLMLVWGGEIVDGYLGLFRTAP